MNEKKLNPVTKTHISDQTKEGPISAAEDSRPAVRFVDRDKAMKIARKIMKQNHDLFRKLAQ